MQELVRKQFTLLLALSLWALVSECGFCQKQLLPISDQVDARILRSAIRNYTPNAWTSVRVSVENPTDEDVEGRLHVYFGSSSHLQFAYDYWVPARTRLRGSLPVKLPRNLRSRRSTVEAHYFSTDRSASPQDVVRRNNHAPIIDSMLLSLEDERVKTGVIFDPGPTHLERLDMTDTEWARNGMESELVSATRLAAHSTRLLMELRDDFQSPHPHSLDSLSQIVVGSDRLLHDPAGIIALRRWLQAGGTMWIMLDRVGPESVTRLLGDSIGLSFVDRVSLTELEFTSNDPVISTKQVSRSFDVPVEMVRVVTDSTRVSVRVNGWPGAFWHSVGSGRVFLTTVDAAAWIQPRQEPVDTGRRSRSNSNDPKRMSPYEAIGPLRELARNLFNEKRGLTPEEREVTRVLAEQIGYAVPKRWPVSLTLGGFCLALLGSGSLLIWLRRLEWMVWLVPTFALVATLVFATMGAGRRNAIRPTFAEHQMIRVTHGGQEAAVHGVAAMYSNTGDISGLGADASGVLMPDMEGIERNEKRMLWLDVDQWQWEQLTIPSGAVRAFPFRTFTSFESPVQANALITEDGLAGKLAPGSFSNIGEAVLIAPQKNRAVVRLEDDGSFLIQQGDTLDVDRYIGGSIIGDRGRRRQELYRLLIGNEETHGHIHQPLFCFFADPVDMRFLLPGDYRRLGEALVVAPLQLTHPEPGSKVTIPPTLIQIETVVDRQGSSTAFSERTGRWTPSLSNAARPQLRFMLPAAVQPMQVEQVTLIVKANIPARDFVITVPDGDQEVELASFHGFSGKQEIELERTDLLQAGPRGGIRLGLRISESDEQKEKLAKSGGVVRQRASESQFEAVDRSGLVAMGDTWTINYVKMQVKGTVSE